MLNGLHCSEWAILLCFLLSSWSGTFPVNVLCLENAFVLLDSAQYCLSSGFPWHFPDLPMGSLLSIYAFIIALFISTVLRAVAVTFHGKRDFADVIKSRIRW